MLRHRAADGALGAGDEQQEEHTENSKGDLSDLGKMGVEQLKSMQRKIFQALASRGEASAMGMISTINEAAEFDNAMDNKGAAIGDVSSKAQQQDVLTEAAGSEVTGVAWPSEGLAPKGGGVADVTEPGKVDVEANQHALLQHDNWAGPPKSRK